MALVLPAKGDGLTPETAFRADVGAARAAFVAVLEHKDGGDFFALVEGAAAELDAAQTKATKVVALADVATEIAAREAKAVAVVADEEAKP